jgi:hypothetical protein
MSKIHPANNTRSSTNNNDNPKDQIDKTIHTHVNDKTQPSTNTKKPTKIFGVLTNILGDYGDIDKMRSFVTLVGLGMVGVIGGPAILTLLNGFWNTILYSSVLHNQSRLYYNTSNNIISYVPPNNDTSKNKEVIVNDPTTGAKTVTYVPPPPVVDENQYGSSYYIPKPHVSYTIILLFFQFLFYMFLTYILYLWASKSSDKKEQNKKAK